MKVKTDIKAGRVGRTYMYDAPILNNLE